jgi:pimeloyl-ACP methyl ester carboxylesterase
VPEHTIRGVKMHWREAGEGDPLIFIHGFPFNSSLWDAQLAAVPAGWKFIAPDLRGFGASEATGEPFSMDIFADDIAALLDHLELDQAVICGMSMGGYVALSLVMRQPDRVRALVLSATRASADSEEARRARLELAARARVQGPQPVIDAMLPHLLTAHTELKQPEVVAKVREMMEATPAQTLARSLEAMAARRDYTNELSSINVSTMVVRGEQDEMIPAADMELIARTVRGARHEVISFAGHMPPLEASDVFNNILSHFLAQLPPALKLGDFDFSF